MNEAEAIKPLQDTAPEAERAWLEMTRRAPLWKRAEQWSNLVVARRDLLLVDLRRRYPQAGDDELRKRLAARLLSREEVIRIFDWDPEKEGY